MIKKLTLLAMCLAPTQVNALPLGLKGRVQLSQAVNRDQVVAVQGDQETSIYGHLARKWELNETISYDAKLSASSSYRYDTNRLGNTKYKIAVGINF